MAIHFWKVVCTNLLQKKKIKITISKFNLVAMEFFFTFPNHKIYSGH